MYLRVVCLAGMLLAPAVVLCAQQHLEIDPASGREIVSDWTYGFREIAAIDHERRLVYVVDASEPLSVMAFSIDDGALVGRYGGREGEGPGEPQFMVAIAAASNGVLVSDHVRVNHWDLEGELLSTWRPPSPGVFGVCELNGQPAVPLPAGLAARAADGSNVVVGTADLVIDDLEAAGQAVLEFAASHVMCINDTAYVLGVDGLVAYEKGREFQIPLPTEIEERGRRRRESARGGAFLWPYTGLFDDDEGNLVVTIWASELAGAVIDPETGCYALLHDPGPYRASRRLVGIHRDSLVVLEGGTSVRMIEGKRRTVIDPEPFVIALRPLRPVGGNPCPPTGPPQ